MTALFSFNNLNEINKFKTNHSKTVVVQTNGIIDITTDEEFRQYAKSGNLVLIYEYSKSCLHCKYEQNPIINEIVENMAGKVTFCRYDIWANKDSKRYMWAVPCIIIFNKG